MNPEQHLEAALTDEGKKKMAGRIDWAAFLALILKILPVVAPFLGTASTPTTDPKAENHLKAAFGGVVTNWNWTAILAIIQQLLALFGQNVPVMPPTPNVP